MPATAEAAGGPIGPGGSQRDVKGHRRGSLIRFTACGVGIQEISSVYPIGMIPIQGISLFSDF